MSYVEPITMLAKNIGQHFKMWWADRQMDDQMDRQDNEELIPLCQPNTENTKRLSQSS